MTPHEHAEGTLLLPSNAFNALHAEVRDAYNAHLQRVLARAQFIYHVLTRGPEKVAPEDRKTATRIYAVLYPWNKEAWWARTEVRRPTAADGWGLPAMIPNGESRACADLVRDEVMDLLVDEDDEAPAALREPDADRLGLARANAREFQLPLARIAFDHDRNTVTWQVPPGPRNTAKSMEHPVVRKLFENLRHLEWKPGTGGVLRFFLGDDAWPVPCGPEGHAALAAEQAMGNDLRSEAVGDAPPAH